MRFGLHAADNTRTCQYRRDRWHAACRFARFFGCINTLHVMQSNSTTRFTNPIGLSKVTASDSELNDGRQNQCMTVMLHEMTCNSFLSKEIIRGNTSLVKDILLIFEKCADNVFNVFFLNRRTVTAVLPQQPTAAVEYALHVGFSMSFSVMMQVKPVCGTWLLSNHP